MGGPTLREKKIRSGYLSINLSNKNITSEKKELSVFERLVIP